MTNRIVNVTNIGNNPRAIYDVHGKIKHIPIGESKMIDLNETIIEKMQEARQRGDSLLIGEKGKSKGPVKTLGTDEPPAGGTVDPGKQTPLSVLAKIGEYTYHDLLAAVNDVCPHNQLGQRPSISEMMTVLKEAAAKDEEGGAEASQTKHPAATPQRERRTPRPAAKRNRR